MKILLLLTFCAITQLDAANVIVNGHFENSTQPSGTFGSHPSIPGWSPLGTVTAVYLARPPIPTVATWPITGQGGSAQFIDIGNTPGTGIVQTVTIPIGFNLPQLSWYDSTSNINTSLSTYQVRLRNASNAIVTSGSFSTAVNTWTERTLTGFGPLTAGIYKLEFEPITGAGLKDTLIDNVQLVPEPSTSFLAAAISLLGVFRRRRVS